MVPVHCEDQRHLGLWFGYVPALANGSCRVSDQDTTLRASDLHNARATILNPFNNGAVWARYMGNRIWSNTSFLYNLDFFQSGSIVVPLHMVAVNNLWVSERIIKGNKW